MSPTHQGDQTPDRKQGFTRRQFIVTGAAALLAACAPQARTTTTTSAPGTTAAPGTTVAPGTTAAAGPSGTIRFLNAENFWADWSPYSSTALSQVRIERQIYDFLVDYPSGDISQPVSMLATDWSQVDELTWEFILRDDVTFHDGQALTADDVKASVELASGFSGDSAYSLWWLPAQVEVRDNLTLRITTEQPFAALLPALGWHTPILSAAWLGGDQDRLASEPNGTGPFRLADDTVEVKTMEANTGYWGGAPNIGTLIWEFIQDPQTRLSALLAGDADVIDRVPPEHLGTLQGEGEVELVSSTAIESVGLFVRPGRLPLWDENVNFRRAVNWSFDRDPLVDNLVLGASAVAGSFIPTNTLYYQQQEPAYRFDQAMAEAELEAAGDNPEFELWVAEGFQPRAVEVIQAMVAQMEQVGLSPRIVTTDVGALIDDVFSETGTGAMYHLSWATNGDPAPASAVYSAAFAWYFGDERLQELIDLGATTPDPAQRQQHYEDLQAHMWEQVWHVPLYNSDFTIAHSSNVQGMLIQPNVLRTDFHTAEIVA